MGNLLLEGDFHVSYLDTSESRKYLCKLCSTLIGKRQISLFLKMKMKVSLETSSTLNIIKVPSYQSMPEYTNDRIYVYDILQSIFAKGNIHYIINNHKRNVDTYVTQLNLYDQYNEEDNVEKNTK